MQRTARTRLQHHTAQACSMKRGMHRARACVCVRVHERRDEVVDALHVSAGGVADRPDVEDPLERALHRIKLLRSEIDDYYANFRVNRDLLELRNLVDCAELIVRSASMRHESRGLHYSRDYPFTLPVSFPTVLMRTLRSGKKPKTNGLSA